MLRSMSLADGARPHRAAFLTSALPLVRLCLAFALLTSVGCYSVPAGKSAVSTVEIEGAPDIDTDDLARRITTREASRFLGFVYDAEVFDRYALRRDLARIERYMQARGFYDAQVRLARVVPDGNKVHVTIEIEQGRPVVIDELQIVGDEPASARTRKRLRHAIERILRKGENLDEEKVDEAEKAALKALGSAGHAGARVERHVEVDLASAKAKATFTVTPGSVARIGPIRWTGLDELPEGKLRHVFGIEEGDPYSGEDIDEARQALLDLGVFASVDIEIDTKELETTHVVPLTIKTEVSKLRALLLGGGFQFDSLKTDLHATIGWQSSNFFGGLRRFEVRFKPGVVLYPTRFPDVQAPEALLPEHRLSATLSQPAFVESRTTGILKAEYNTYPVLLPGSTGQNVVGYHELRGTAGVERTFFEKHLYVSPLYGAQGNIPFDYIGKTPDAETLAISYVDLRTDVDFRDDPNHTRKGFYVGNQLQVAGGLLQGDATDLRVQPEVRGYLPISKRVVLAARASVGFLFPFDYGRYAQTNFEHPGSSRIEGSSRDYQLLFFRGFYSGGPSTNRGYPLRGIGPYDVIPYLSPAGQSISASGCNPNDAGCSLPTGGRTLWEASLELRIVLAGPVAMALFCDAADVSPFSVDIRPERPHLSCGAGGRYDTPVGPIRLDIGYRIPHAQFPKGSSFERPPADFLGKLPIALAFGIGVAF
jgi:outer membrane protein insertion porin family/translocation and assembly module TamA